MTATPIADLIERMLAAGLPHASVVDSVRTIETLGLVLPATLPATLPDALPSERSRKAINQARYRANLKAKQGAGVAMAAAPSPATPTVTPLPTVTGNVTSAPLSILSSLSNSQGIQEEKKERKQEVLNTEPREKRTRGARLPDDWEPSNADRQFAAGRGLRLIDIEIEATKFRNYWTNRTDKQACKPRWDRAWQNWILNVRGGSNGNAPRPGSKDDTRERTVNALRSLDPFPHSDDTGRGEGAGPQIPRQLSLVKPP